jgi:peptidyl-prolyl cis-trans isomerase-like 2
MKHDTNPVTGGPLKQADLIRLNFARNEGKEWVDPVTYKVLTDNTHIVAIRHGDSANVFAYETVERLNIKAKMWQDLVSDEKFQRSDIITLQDPQNLGSRNLADFKYLRDGEDSGVPKEEASINTGAMGNAANLKIMKAKEAVAKARAERDKAAAVQQAASRGLTKPSIPQKSAQKPFNAKHYTTGQAAASFTSTGISVHTSASLALMSDEEYLLRPKRVKKSGFAVVQTSLGELTIELLPEHAPKAVYNFIRLAQKGYYNGIVIHRNIKNFMAQTGDPTGTGRGGASIWGKNFEDEFDGECSYSCGLAVILYGTSLFFCHAPSWAIAFCTCSKCESTDMTNRTAAARRARRGQHGKQGQGHQFIPILHHIPQSTASRSKAHHLRTSRRRPAHSESNRGCPE